MTTITVPYGRSIAIAEVPDGWDIDVIDVADAAALVDPIAATRLALDNPRGGFTWRYSGSVAIAVNDKTRPVPHHHLLPPLLERLAAEGIPDEAVTFYVAVGGHSPMVESEFSQILPPEVLDRYEVVSHDSVGGDLVSLGETARGTPVAVNRRYVESDLKLVVGTIEPHQFAGFSGGVKSAAIGLAGIETIDLNHGWMIDPASRIGTYSTNPARQDIEEIGAMIGVDLALNVVLNGRREIVAVLAGDPVAVMEEGTPLVQRYCQVRVDEPYDVVVASPGGHPKDINVYQSQKAIASAAEIVQTGGTIVLVAACPEGSGSAAYESWVANHRSAAQVLEAFREEGFSVGPHKAFQIARDTVDTHLVVCTEMSRELAQRLLLPTAPDLQAALDGVDVPNGRVAVLPHATTTIPYLA